jgi:MFS family permease
MPCFKTILPSSGGTIRPCDGMCSTALGACFAHSTLDVRGPTPVINERLLLQSYLDDQSLLTGLQAIPQWNSYFHSPSGNWLGLIAACIFLPAIVLSWPAAWICTAFGRRWCIILGSVLIIAGAIFNAMSQDTTQFMVCKLHINKISPQSCSSANIRRVSTCYPWIRRLSYKGRSSRTIARDGSPKTTFLYGTYVLRLLLPWLSAKRYHVQ